MQCIGVAVDPDQNVWGLDSNRTTRALVDNMGAIAQPMTRPPKPENKCPAGDTCVSAGAEAYSDLTSFGPRTFAPPVGTWQTVVRGCVDGNGLPADTEWQQIAWDADVPPSTTLTMRTRSTDKPIEPEWMMGAWVERPASPVTLPGVLMPNWSPGAPEGTVHDGWLVVEFAFSSKARNASPKLKQLHVVYRCPHGP